MRFWVGVTAAFGAGLGIGAGLWSILREEQLKLEYQQSTEAFMNAINLARQKEPQTEVHVHVDTEQFAEAAAEAKEAVSGIKVSDVQEYKPVDTNPYHLAVEKPQASWTYLEEEDYEDDDGRLKERITIMPGDDGMTPVFVQDDIEIADWEEKIGSNILRDFYSMVPPDVSPAILYVRNNVTNVDFEVIREVP